MGVMQVIPPYPVFVDSSGAPLDSGYVYFGTVNLNPELSPIQMFWDSALSIPVAQPVRTINGYLSRNGTPSAIYTSAQFSIAVRDKRGFIVYYSADSSGSPLSALYVSDIGSTVQAYDALTAKLNLVQSWTAKQTMVGAVFNEAQGSNIASASTINLTTATGNYTHITGTTQIDAITLPQGAERTIVFDAALTFKNSANLILPSGADIPTAAGDTAVVRGEAAGVVRCVNYTRANGASVIPPVQIQTFSVVPSSNTLIVSGPAAQTDFRSSTLGSGAVTQLNSAPANFVISSGSTLGTVSGQLARIIVLELNVSGTKEWAVVNAASGLVLDESGLISTTAEGGAGAADSATTIYSATARSNVPYRVHGYFESTQATAGTWVTAPSLIQGAGGKEIITSRITTSVTVATTSGTSIDVTGIPPWAKRIKILFENVSTNGTSLVQLQVGSGSISTSAYSSSGSTLTAGVTTSAAGSGLLVGSGAAAATQRCGLVTLTLQSSTWDAHGGGNHSDTTATWTMGGVTPSLSGPLDRIRLTTVIGTDAFDAGSIKVTWE